MRRKNPAGLLRYVQCHAEGRSVVGLKVFRDHVRTTNWHHLTAWCTVCVVLSARRRERAASLAARRAAHRPMEGADEPRHHRAQQQSERRL